MKLKTAKVLIIGAGGLGCPVLQYLAAAGVGHIGVVDHDKVEASNLQRQILYTITDIGKYKATVAKEKASTLNPFIRIEAYVTNVTSENVLSLIEPYDIVVDGSDNFATRYLLNDVCVIMNKPLVFGSIFKFEGQVSVFNYQDGPTYRCIFPEIPAPDEMSNCAVIGVVATLPGIIGTLQANEVIKIIIGIGEVLSGRLLVINALNMQTQYFDFEALDKNKSIDHLSIYKYVCDSKASSISLEELQELLQTEKVQLVDVREPEEHAAFNIGGINIPLSQIASDNRLFDSDHTIVFYCASGIRSKKAVELLTNSDVKNILSLQDGVRHLQTL
ncbi:putative adenylyltransferase/sulfurtransferase MoeZ [mine drainage metagenome]|uniref:Putative adenylyltransferase/sulfurtransferase MoeZ n=1 Tax=mine drainage metagenome TaxID=410659 RepID=A0A1J5SAT2_9ZZZZ